MFLCRLYVRQDYFSMGICMLCKSNRWAFPRNYQLLPFVYAPTGNSDLKSEHTDGWRPSKNGIPFFRSLRKQMGQIQIHIVDR